MRDLTRFVLSAVWRHRVAGLATFVGILGAVVVALVVMPRTYATEARLLAQRNLVLPVLSNPRRNVPTEADTPTRQASEAILSHTNLVAIVKATDLVGQSRRHRQLLSRLKHGLFERFFPDPPEDVQVERLVGMLKQNLWVNVTDGTVSIGVMWPDPNLAYRIVQAAQENFFEERHTSELALISESINILEGHVSDVNEQIRASIDSMARLRQSVAGTTRGPTVNALRAVAPSSEVLSAQSRLETVRRTIADLEQFRSRRLAEMQATLADQRNTYGAAHPVIANTEQAIRALSADSPQLQQLRREELDLRNTLARLGADPTGTVAPANTDPFVAAAALRGLERIQQDSVLNERMQYARSRLRIAVSSYEDLLSRLDAARIELQTARAAFKYKYGVISPVQVPLTPIKPRPAKFLAAGFVLASMLGLFVAVALDVTGGRVLHHWQIQRSLGLEVFGEAPPV
ncbi:lipopolysaccharide biosynthesis protein [Gemmatirosa kalamazoonensis]|uniref:Lipopolysaccharide biosynthesis protein n=1 Tax=Gemmatirosa kalamazoonensis TaxID=861299 RepID=W0RE63_9BACT|nr:hypothetical protein [Gemmatirosa kalamazoonensis]AHG87673.1 lipopolysaccharide biosynthesis protein [Gemmatirosa kalamazoonensis]